MSKGRKKKKKRKPECRTGIIPGKTIKGAPNILLYGVIILVIGIVAIGFLVGWGFAIYWAINSVFTILIVMGIITGVLLLGVIGLIVCIFMVQGKNKN